MSDDFLSEVLNINYKAISYKNNPYTVINLQGSIINSSSIDLKQYLIS